MGEGQGPASPERLSPQVKLMVGRPVAALYQPVAAGLAGLTAAVIVGGVVSTLMPEIVAAVLTLPAMSVTVRETDWFGLSFKVTAIGHAPAATPDPGTVSAQTKLTVGFPVAALYQPVGAGFAGLMLAVIVGGVVSTLMPEIVAEALLPAISVTDRV